MTAAACCRSVPWFAVGFGSFEASTGEAGGTGTDFGPFLDLFALGLALRGTATGASALGNQDLKQHREKVSQPVPGGK